MQLFVAMVLDRTMRGVILCYDIAPVENIDNWACFLGMLLKSTDNIDDPSIPFIFDWKKGLHIAM